MCQKFFVSLAATITISFYPNTAQAQTAPQNIQVPTNTPTDASNLIPSTNSVNPYGDINQQGIINNGLNSLSQPNCRSNVCLFTLIRNTTQGTEFLGGAVWQLGGSPEQTQAESQKLLAIAQKEKLDQESAIILTEKLADAIENKKIERAKLYAIILAPKLGYKDYIDLLQEVVKRN